MMIKTKLSGKHVTRAKLPKGFRVTVYPCENGFYDCRVWRNGQIVLSTSGTCFDTRDQARIVGNRRAWDIAQEKEHWT